MYRPLANSKTEKNMRVYDARLSALAGAALIGAMLGGQPAVAAAKAEAKPEAWRTTEEASAKKAEKDVAKAEAKPSAEGRQVKVTAAKAEAKPE
jgi:hypothetical protein